MSFEFRTFSVNGTKWQLLICGMRVRLLRGSPAAMISAVVAYTPRSCSKERS